MVTYKVRITPEAYTDLSQIEQNIRRRESDKRAVVVRQGIMKAIRKLQVLPESHQIFQEISDEQIVFRRMLTYKYKIVFTVNKDELVVLVVKIYHGRQSQDDIEEELKS